MLIRPRRSGESRAPLDLDWQLLLATVVLALIGAAFIHSTTMEGMDGALGKQVVYLGVGIVAMAVVLRVDYRTLASWSPWLYAGGMVLLLAVLVVGKEVGGNKAWLRLGPLSLQPSEPMKVATVLLVAHLCARQGSAPLRFRHVALLLAVIGAPVGLILLQDDLGTAVTYFPLLAAVVFVSGLRWRWLVAAAVVLALLAPVGWSVLKPYQKMRIKIVFQPELDPRGHGYHALHSRIAVGSGGLLGQGYREGPQNRLGFLPERHNDFIFAVVAEEIGFVGAVAVLALYLFVIKRIADAAVLARDRLGAFTCIGAMMMIAVHVSVNVGMVLGLLPTIGIPLPLLSLGGSSLLSTACLVALAANVRLRRLGA